MLAKAPSAPKRRGWERVSEIAGGIASAGSTILAVGMAFAMGGAGLSVWWMLLPLIIAALANRTSYESGYRWGHQLSMAAFYLAAKRGEGKVIVYLRQPPERAGIQITGERLAE